MLEEVRHRQVVFRENIWCDYGQTKIAGNAKRIEIAKSRGSYKNCGKKTEIDEEEFSEDLKILQAGKLTKVELAKKMNVSRPTLDKMIKERA